MVENVSLRALHAALDGLAARQRAVGDNIANVNTPYFTGRRVSFEADLKRAVEDGADPMATQTSVSFTQDSYGLNYNNVNLDAETVIGVDTGLRYDLALRAVGDRFSLLRSAIRGG